ncbi:MAG: biopolymer transporter ExbD [Verrucomicrobiota bacterium]
MAKKSYRPEGDDSPDLTPMIDVVFLLIVFFMTVAVVIQADKVEIEIPVAEESQVPDSVGNRSTFTVTEDGQFYAGPIPVTEAEMGEIVLEKVTNTPNYKVYLRADANTPHKHVRNAMAVCAENGAFEIVFATFQAE